MTTWLVISLFMSICKVYNADKFVLTVSERYIEADMNGMERYYEYATNSSIFTSYLIFVNCTLILIFNFWTIQFVLRPASSYIIIVFFLSLIICSIICMDACKRFQAHMVLWISRRTNGKCKQGLYILLANLFTWSALILLVKRNCLQPFFNINLLNLVIGFIWVPQIVANTVSGRKDVPGNCYVVITSVYLLFLPVSIHLLPKNIFMFEGQPIKCTLLVLQVLI